MKHTLQLTTPFGRTLILVLPLLCILILAGEVIIRHPLIYSKLKTPSLNSRHYHIERQWYRLQELTRTGIEIDCIALGNSMTVSSFDPILFSQNFQSETGIKLLQLWCRCTYAGFSGIPGTNPGRYISSKAPDLRYGRARFCN
jgi:hypothetical protein